MIWLVQDHALGEWSSIARLDVKLNGLTFDERLTTFSLNLRVVHKDVGLAIDSDESPTLFVVEPLDGSYSHCGPPCFFGTDSHRSRREPQRQPQLESLLDNSTSAKCNYGRRMRVPRGESSTTQPKVTNSSRSRSASDQSLVALAASRCSTSSLLASSTSPPWAISANPIAEKRTLTAPAIVCAISSSPASAALFAAASASKRRATASGVFMSSSRTAATLSKSSFAGPSHVKSEATSRVLPA